EEQILKEVLYPIDAVQPGARLVVVPSGEESLIQFCHRIHQKLQTDHVICPEAKARELQRELRAPSSAVCDILTKHFHRLIIIESIKGLGRDGVFDHDHCFLPYLRENLFSSFGIAPTDDFHPEQISQVVKDEPPALFCFLDAQHI